jgi:hypothetical protein
LSRGNFPLVNVLFMKYNGQKRSVLSWNYDTENTAISKEMSMS